MRQIKLKEFRSVQCFGVTELYTDNAKRVPCRTIPGIPKLVLCSSLSRLNSERHACHYLLKNTMDSRRPGSQGHRHHKIAFMLIAV